MQPVGRSLSYPGLGYPSRELYRKTFFKMESLNKKSLRSPALDHIATEMFINFDLSTKLIIFPLTNNTSATGILKMTKYALTVYTAMMI